MAGQSLSPPGPPPDGRSYMRVPPWWAGASGGRGGRVGRRGSALWRAEGPRRSLEWPESSSLGPWVSPKHPPALIYSARKELEGEW